MVDVLARIVARKRQEMASRLGGQPVEAAPTHRSLRAALSKPGVRFIMEIKPRSPSGHRALHHERDALAAYRPVADAISVLTDEEDFGGSLDLLEVVRRDFDGPILAKDFIVDPAQVSEARRAGADAVLAMLSVLDDEQTRSVMAEARRLGMDVLVEVRDEDELGRALALGAILVGINNRDLASLRVDLATTERLAALVPDDVILVSESGIAGRRDVERLAPMVDAFLVGSALMAAPDIDLAARALVHGPIKLCGLTREEDIALASRQGATHAGLIMVPGTPRAVAIDRAATLAETARASGLKTVGVFRDEGPRAVADAASRLGLDAIQLHGRETGAMIESLRRHLPRSSEIWTLCGVGDHAAPPRGGDRTLFDTIADGRSGGTGHAFDWKAIAGRPDLRKAFLAGGIGPTNARDAARLGAYGLDIGSGIEARPGEKDAGKVAALFAALRPADRRAARC
ncbi:bifunctional indole-3-glycerol-phosphate synthase TrpC/phosphoribosylanthranilate isomerase TrpF [Sphingomicrobium nitratireducens]|uniref:bifunctional indole-3-glycerol-phosphate synthase TrpC/phosphoribosylanthranilate isomerase TrpF n=1 Tax=Sphingomicrobium nitratireducens TaxID=2964666 RepID=UPI00223EA446